jgi:histone H3/H4
MFLLNSINKISFSFSANQYASNAKRKTVTVHDVFKSLQTNQFDMLVEPLQEALKGKI